MSRLSARSLANGCMQEAGANDLRAATNIGAVFDKIKLDFYHRLDG